MTAQKTVNEHSGILWPAPAEKATGLELLGLVRKNSWDALVKIAADPMFDPRRGLEQMFWAVEEVDSKPAQWRFTLAKAVDETVWAPDPPVHFLGTCAELMTL